MGERFPYLKEVSSQALQQVRRDSETAYKNFFESLKGKRSGAKVGSPKFKSKKSNNFSYRECSPSKTALNWKERKVKVPKLGEVKFRHSGN